MSRGWLAWVVFAVTWIGAQRDARAQTVVHLTSESFSNPFALDVPVDPALVRASGDNWTSKLVSVADASTVLYVSLRGESTCADANAAIGGDLRTRPDWAPAAYEASIGTLLCLASPQGVFTINIGYPDNDLPAVINALEGIVIATGVMSERTIVGGLTIVLPFTWVAVSEREIVYADSTTRLWLTHGDWTCWDEVLRIAQEYPRVGIAAWVPGGFHAWMGDAGSEDRLCIDRPDGSLLVFAQQAEANQDAVTAALTAIADASAATPNPNAIHVDIPADLAVAEQVVEFREVALTVTVDANRWAKDGALILTIGGIASSKVVSFESFPMNCTSWEAEFATGEHLPSAAWVPPGYFATMTGQVNAVRLCVDRKDGALLVDVREPEVYQAETTALLASIAAAASASSAPDTTHAPRKSIFPLGIDVDLQWLVTSPTGGSSGSGAGVALHFDRELKRANSFLALAVEADASLGYDASYATAYDARAALGLRAGGEIPASTGEGVGLRTYLQLLVGGGGDGMTGGDTFELEGASYWFWGIGFALAMPKTKTKLFWEVTFAHRSIETRGFEGETRATLGISGVKGWGINAEVVGFPQILVEGEVKLLGITKLAISHAL